MPLYLRLTPLYIFAALGFVAGRWLGVRKESIAPLLIYLLTPIVVGRGALGADPHALVLPAIVFATCSVICFAARAVADRFFSPPTAGILSFAAGNCNSGYFGLPAASAVLGEAAFSQAVLIAFGFVLYENTVGFYVAARGRFSVKESVKKLLSLPAVYAFAAGFLLHALGVQAGDGIDGFVGSVRGAYAVLGMMLLGLALADLRSLELNIPFTVFAGTAKFIIWPLAVLALSTVLHDPFEQKGLWLAAFLPMAANTVAYATLFGAEPEQASLAVMLSTLLSPVRIALAL